MFYQGKKVSAVFYGGKKVWPDSYSAGTKFTDSADTNPHHFAIDKSKASSKFSFTFTWQYLISNEWGDNTWKKALTINDLEFPTSISTQYAKTYDWQDDNNYMYTLHFTFWWNNAKDFIIRIDTIETHGGGWESSIKPPLTVTIE